MEIIDKQPSTKGPAEWFTGDVWFDVIVGLGVFQTPPDETRDAVRTALGSGWRLIDPAAAYGNERQVGETVHTARA